MKRFLAWILLGIITLSCCGCSSSNAPSSQSNVPDTELVVQPQAPAAAETIPVLTEPEVLEGSLYLTVSSLTFSLVGESEDVYLGVIPRELVTWESEDPNVVSVENGVLTATGVGTTTIHAAYMDRQVSCAVGCLAQTQEELDGLAEDIISAPKRIPPAVDLEEPCTYFDNAALVGDSITYYLLQWESKGNQLGAVQFLCRGGVSVNGFVIGYKNLYYQGKEMALEDVIAKSQVERAYFLLGSNDVGDDNNRSLVFKNWSTLLERIREKHPDVEIVFQSNTPEYIENRHAQQKNNLIHEYNAQLRQFAKDNGCLFLDLGSYYEDHYGRMPKSLNLDNYHMNEDGGMMWMQILRYYAQFESEGGSLK